MSGVTNMFGMMNLSPMISNWCAKYQKIITQELTTTNLVLYMTNQKIAKNADLENKYDKRTLGQNMKLDIL